MTGLGIGGFQVHINFVPAINAPASNVNAPVSASTPSTSSTSVSVSAPAYPSFSASVVLGTDFSVVSSANFIPASAFTSSSCIGTTQ